LRGAGAAQIAAHQTRQEKLSLLSHEEMRARHEELAAANSKENTRSVPLPVELMQINCRTCPFSLQSWAFEGNLVRGRDRSACRFANWMTMGFLRLTFEVEDA
jgi:hypothetical protein